jgi:hypothetical protein
VAYAALPSSGSTGEPGGGSAGHGANGCAPEPRMLPPLILCNHWGGHALTCGCQLSAACPVAWQGAVSCCLSRPIPQRPPGAKRKGGPAHTQGRPMQAHQQLSAPRSCTGGTAAKPGPGGCRSAVSQTLDTGPYYKTLITLITNSYYSYHKLLLLLLQTLITLITNS